MHANIEPKVDKAALSDTPQGNELASGDVSVGPANANHNNDSIHPESNASRAARSVKGGVVDGVDIGIVVMSLMRQGRIDPSEVDSKPMTSSYYLDRASRKRRATIEIVGVDIGFVPGDPAVVVRSFVKDEDGNQRQLPFVEFIEPHLVDEYVKTVLEMRDEASKHKDEVITVQQADSASLGEDDRPIDEADDEEVDVVSTFVVRICPEHELIELKLIVEGEIGEDAPRIAVALRPEHVHSLARALEAARDDSGRGKHTIVFGSRNFV